MSKYLIHSCNQRKWYVDGYLVPALTEQGILSDNIKVYNDDGGEGCLASFLLSCEMLDGDGGTWHLQDDVVISKDFRIKTEKYDNGIVCGFCNNYSNQMWGYVDLLNMWYSFPCIRIPNNILKDFNEWLDISMSRFYAYTKDNRHIDVLFRRYLLDNEPDTVVLNLTPNIVNHIDYLIGGSVINSNRRMRDVGSTYWNDMGEIDELRHKLSIDKHCI